MTSAYPDPHSFIDPDTGIPRNLLGISDAKMLSKVEADISLVALYRLQLQPIAGNYDLDHLREIHRALFGVIYPWAGQLRTGTIAKGEPFAPPDTVLSETRHLLASLAAEDHLRGLDLQCFINQSAAYYAWLNTIHPFPEGNGRTQRVFFGQLALDAGYFINWNRLDPRINIAVSREATYEDTEPLEVALADIIAPRQPVYGTPEQTADHLSRRTTQAANLALRVRRQADQLHHDTQRGEGRLGMRHADDLQTATNQVAAIRAAHAAHSAYDEGQRRLLALEAEQRRILGQLHPLDGVPRANRTGLARLDNELTLVSRELEQLRSDVTDLAAYAGETAAIAGPCDTWETTVDAALELAERSDFDSLYALQGDYRATADLYQLAGWLDTHATDLAELAAGIRGQAIDPIEAGIPIDGVPVPVPQQAPAQQPHTGPTLLP